MNSHRQRIIGTLSFSLCIFLYSHLSAQDHPSIHQTESEFYRQHPEMIGSPVEVHPFQKRADLMKGETLNKVVYGFHPYWQNGSESNYYFSLLTHVAYFSGDVDYNTGNFTSTHSWSSANVVGLAKSYGVKVHFSVVLFSNHATLLGSAQSKNNLIKNILAQIDLRNADGCNIDFESISASQAVPYRDFLKQLGDSLKAHNKELVVELFAVDWSNIFPSTFFQTLDPVVDYYFIMLYDYYWPGSANAGPNSPLRPASASGYHVLKSIQAYIDRGCPAGKLIAGFPNYGQDWPVTSSSRMAATTAKGVARTFSVVKNNYIDTIPAANQFFDATYATPWYRYISGGSWRQCWYDDSLSWAMKFNAIAPMNIGGTGMWALGYDGSEPELWGALKSAFAQEGNVSGILEDFESGTGKFTTAPTYSGTTHGIAATSSMKWTKNFSHGGWGSLQLTLNDDITTTDDWVVRSLSAAGNPDNNVGISDTSSVGLWIQTGTAPPGAQVAISMDNGIAGTLISARRDVVNDGTWHYYEWNLQSSPWTILAGSDTIFTSPSVTLDGIMLYAPNATGGQWTLNLDDIQYTASENPTSVHSTPIQTSAPKEYAVVENFPNPFNPSTTIRFSIPRTGHATLKIYNSIGREVASLFEGIMKGGEDHNVMFDATQLSSGMYVTRLEWDGGVSASKMVLLK